MSIDLPAYSRPEVFDQEVASIFSERLYVGSAMDFAEIDAYRSFRLGSKVVTVRGTSEGVRAYGNVCLHRSNLIDPLGDGKKRFMCGFHGWSYDAEGELAATPFADKSCVARHALPTFPVSESNGFVFLGLGGTPPELDKFPDALRTTQVVRTEPFHRESMLHDCNWKLLVENILESYHLNFVHRSTFLKSGFTSTSTHRFEADGYVNLASIVPDATTDKTAAVKKLARDATHSYKHAFVFPNLFISNTNDLIGFVSYMLPVDASRTLLTWELFELPAMQALAGAIREHIRNEAIEFSRVTLAEDKEMVEACQIGISSDMGSVQLQPVEDRVAQFHDYYNQRMKHAQ